MAQWHARGSCYGGLGGRAEAPANLTAITCFPRIPCPCGRTYAGTVDGISHAGVMEEARDTEFGCTSPGRRDRGVMSARLSVRPS